MFRQGRPLIGRVARKNKRPLQQPTLPNSIFWWSSRTIRAASMRRQVLKGTMTEVDAEKAVAVSPDEYMILVQSTSMYIFQQRGEKAFESAGYLQTKKTKQKISPSHVAFLKGPDGQRLRGRFSISLKRARTASRRSAPTRRKLIFTFRSAAPSS
jgi:hypothetical protein